MSDEPLHANVVTLLAITLGRRVAPVDIDWAGVFQIAIAERCAPLAWLRSSAVIRASAPGAVVDAWRREAIGSHRLACFWRAVIGDVYSAFESAEVHATILKGLPLATRLYGDEAARLGYDLDIFVAPAARAKADAALRRAGLRWIGGTPPSEASYSVSRLGLSGAVEIHSALLDGALTAHLPFKPPGSELRRIDEAWVPVHADDQLPAYLATHLVKHKVRPLLWFIDFATLWGSLDCDSRARALAVAKAARAHRYLEWAIVSAQLIQVAADGDGDSLRELGFRGGVRRTRHYAALLAALAGTRRDSLRIWAAWIGPKVFRSEWPSINAETLRNASRKLSLSIRSIPQEYRTPAPPTPEASIPARMMRLDSAEFSSLVDELVQRDQEFWVGLEGQSMSPTIPTASIVKFSPARGRSPRIGRVVLARVAPQNYVVHRVIGKRGLGLILRGDANERCDPLISSDSIIAFAEQQLHRGETRLRPVGGRRLLTRLTVRRAMRALAARIAWGARGARETNDVARNGRS